MWKLERSKHQRVVQRVGKRESGSVKDDEDKEETANGENQLREVTFQGLQIYDARPHLRGHMQEQNPPPVSAELM